jgi:hypothetical protein
MASKTTLSAIALTLLGSLATGSVGFAQDAPVAHPPNQNHDMMSGTNPSQGPGMMGGGSMADMTNMMRQMTRTMENCNRMMESTDQKPPTPENPPEAKTPPG